MSMPGWLPSRGRLDGLAMGLFQGTLDTDKRK